jgi:YbgC/YbaW family acyl-CoA thioester hydrolase
MAAFERPLRVHFHQGDPAGVLFYGRVFELIEVAYEDMCRAAGVDIDALMHQHLYTTPVARVEVDYFQPIRVGEEVTVRAAVERVGTSSITMHYTLLGAEGDLRAEARVVHVLVDARTWNAVTVPEDVRAAYLHFAES